MREHGDTVEGNVGNVIEFVEPLRGTPFQGEI